MGRIGDHPIPGRHKSLAFLRKEAVQHLHGKVQLFFPVFQLLIQGNVKGRIGVNPAFVRGLRKVRKSYQLAAHVGFQIFHNTGCSPKHSGFPMDKAFTGRFQVAV